MHVIITTEITKENVGRVSSQFLHISSATHLFTIVPPPEVCDSPVTQYIIISSVFKFAAPSLDTWLVSCNPTSAGSLATVRQI
jgi:hypothetical protein